MTRAPQHLQTSSERRRNCFHHFARRLAERVSRDMDATRLWLEVIEGVNRSDRTNISFVARLNRRGRRLWRVQVSARRFFIVYDHKLNCPVTVLPLRGHCYKQKGKHYVRVSLEELE